MKRQLKLSARDVFMIHMAIEAAVDRAGEAGMPALAEDFSALRRRLPGPPACGCAGCRPGGGTRH